MRCALRTKTTVVVHVRAMRRVRPPAIPLGNAGHCGVQVDQEFAPSPKECAPPKFACLRIASRRFIQITQSILTHDRDSGCNSHNRCVFDKTNCELRNMFFSYRCFNLFASFALTAGIRTRRWTGSIRTVPSHVPSHVPSG